MTEVLTETDETDEPDESDRTAGRWWAGAAQTEHDALAGVEIDEPPHVPFVRSWSDAVQVAAAFAVLAAVVLLVRAAPEGIRGLERDLGKPFDSLPAGASSFLVAAIQVVAAYAPFAVVTVVLLGHRLRGLALIVVAGVASSLLLRTGVAAALDVPTAARAATRFDFRGFSPGGPFPSSGYIAAAVAVVTVEMPWLARAWRRALVVILAVLGVGRLAAGTARDLPVELPAAYATGWFVGCAVLLAFGRPNRRPQGRDVVVALARCGVRLVTVRATSVRRAYRRDFEGIDDRGRAVYVKIREGDDRAAEAAVRVLRYLRVREVTDEHPFWSPIRRAEHEALVALKAHADGVGAPVVRAVTTVGAGGNALVAFDRFAGRVADQLDPDEWTDELLGRVWAAARRLHEARINHRDLRPGNLVVLDDGDIGFLNFTNAELGASDSSLANDAAELLSSTAVRVGAPRAVAAAVDAIGTTGVRRALPRLQPLALTGPTRAELREQPELLDQVAELVREVSGAESVAPDQLERVKPRQVAMVVMGAFALYALLPQAAQAPNIISQLTRADWWWVTAAVAASALTYVGAAVALTGASPTRLPFVPTVVAQVAVQFANCATPAAVGGYALNVRFLHKRGADTPVAVATVGVNALAGVVVHLTLLGTLAYWAGSEDELHLELPVRTVVLALLVIAALVAGMLVFPASRAFGRARIVPLLERSVAGIREIALRPLKLTQVLGGALILTSSYIAALVCSLHAFGTDLPVATVGVVFLAGAAVAAAVPTPGGLGAVEAALVAGLLGVGVDSTTAVSAVIVHRVATFWLPLTPGWLAFTALQRRGDI